jgi:aspartyl-tRNA(Asn)/glutamyl-tRNA(Gln) amidotransferase subunit A
MTGMNPDELAGALRAFVRMPVHTGAADGPLAGWTIALKDNIDVAGDVVEVGARLFTGRRATATATAARRLLAAGATLSGRTQLVELCFGSWGINDYTGTAVNPWDARVQRVPGGSSGGSAVAVAARLVRAALGSDTAGSIRMPASLCGVTGLKSTFGAVPTDGVFPLAPSYDSVGPLAVTAADCAAVHSVLAADPALARQGPARGGRIAVLPEGCWPVPVEPAVAQAVGAAAAEFAARGFELVPADDPPDLAALTQQAGVLVAHEAWKVLRADFRRKRESFGADMQRRMRAARELSDDAIAQAWSGRLEATRAFDRWARGFDALLLPVVGCSAPPVSQVQDRGSTLGHFTRWVNHVGGCALSLPGGFDDQGLPVGIQLVGRGGQDATVLGLGQAFQEGTGWHERVPELAVAGAGAVSAPGPSR